MGRLYHLVLNPGSGTAAALGLDGPGLVARFAAAGLTATVDDAADRPFADRLAAARDGPADVIVAAGGDGTATALAGALAGTDKILAVLPLGTANLLARDLALPLDLDAAIAALPAMTVRRIDVGTVNGTLFLHKVVIGSIPVIAAGRERMRGHYGIGPILRFLRFLWRRLRRARRLAVEIRTDEGRRRLVRAQAVAVANNVYDEGFARVFARARLDRGTLGLYILRRLSPSDALRLAIGMLMGRWRGDAALIVREVKAVTIRARRPFVAAMVDGELRRLTIPIDVRIHPRALKVLAGPEAAG